MSCCPTNGSPWVEVEQLASAQRFEKATARLSIEAIAAPTLRQCAANAIAAAQNAFTMFAMAAMLERHTAQLKMPRPDAYDRPVFQLLLQVSRKVGIRHHCETVPLRSV